MTAATVIPSAAEDRLLRELCDWALDLAHVQGGRQFTAAVMRGDQEVARARNDVAETCDASRHAEIAAMAQAGRAMARVDLSGHALLSSCQPCEMCLAAMRWAGITRLIFAARQEALGEGFFKFGRLTIADLHSASGGAFEYLGGLHEARVLAMYRTGEA
jgi:tRNA(Arg) A34 adenosine deaminase TadA